MTTADSLSVTRLGDAIKIDDFWATLAVYIPDSDNNEQAIANGLYLCHLKTGNQVFYKKIITLPFLRHAICLLVP